MKDIPQLYIAEIAQKENSEEGEDEHMSQELAEVAPDRMVSQNTNVCKHVNQDPMSDSNSFPCQHCERKFTSEQALERHMHIHTLGISEAHAHKSNRNSKSFGLNLGQQHCENMTLLDTSVTQLHISLPSSFKPSALLAGEPSTQPERKEELDGHYGCKYCEKVFTSHTSQRRHERRVHEQEVQPTCALKSQLPEQNYHLQSAIGETSQHSWSEPNGSTALSSVTETEQAEQYMLDISSNISENLSIYIDGKILSTSTVSSCESAEASSLIRLDSLILDHYQDIDGQPPARRRTATPPLLPQIKTELESEVVVSSATSSLVCSLIENILPQNSESAIVQKERMVFLSPKLKQLLEKQDGLQPALALLADGHKPCSPVSLSALPAGQGRFKRRTGSPSSSPTTTEESPTLDSEDCQAVSMVQVETQNTYVPVHQTASEINDPGPSFEDPKVKNNLNQDWPPLTGGNSCNQQPLDLSNALKRNEDKDEAVLDLSLQKTSQNKSELTVNSVSPAVSDEERPSAVALGQDVLNTGEQNVDPRNPEATLVTDFAIVEDSNMIPSVEPVAERLIYGLALSPNPLNPTAASLASVALQQASPCAIAFASPVSNGILPTTHSLITVLAPPPIPNPTNQPIQVLTPNLTPEPLLICAENALNSSQCNLTPAFAAANRANLVALSQPLDPALNLPGHMFLTDHITLNQPLVESAAPITEVPFSPTMNLTDPLINSYDIAGNTVLIECTIALEAPGSLVQPVVALPENAVESSAPPEVVVNGIKQIVTVANSPQVDPPVIVSSVTEPVTLATTASVPPDDPNTEDFSTESNPDVELETPTIKADEEGDGPDFSSPVSSQLSPSSAEAVGDESTSNVTSNEQPQTFAKNFTCNVCDKLFHSMKALGEHVSHHADEWPYKCEFCVLLFVKPDDLLEHRSSLHGVARAYVCSCCTKDFVYLSNLKQHQEELHPGQQCTYTEEEKGKLRPHNYNNWVKASNEPLAPDELKESQKAVKKEGEVDGAAEELLTTIKILASDDSKTKGPDVRLGINQHYPSFKPPPFPYHNRSPSVSVASATNFTTHNIPQTFSTAIRCTKCGKSFDNMPELHKHILACASASDKKRYTPKKNPIPLRHFAKTQNGGVLSTNGLNASNRPSQSQKSKPDHEPSVKVKLKVLKKRKKQFVQRVMPQRNKSVSVPSRVAHMREEAKQVFVCPHCRRDFTMRRSRTKHMAVCPKKPKEAKKQKEDGVSVTKENNGRLLRATDDKAQETSPQHRTRLQTAASSAKRHAVVPVQTVFSSKRSKIIIKESVQPEQETPSLCDLPMGRTFTPSMRQYSRTPQRVKGIPLNITLVNTQQKEQEQELASDQNREKGSADILGNLQQDPGV